MDKILSIKKTIVNKFITTKLFYIKLTFLKTKLKKQSNYLFFRFNIAKILLCCMR